MFLLHANIQNRQGWKHAFPGSSYGQGGYLPYLQFASYLTWYLNELFVY